MKKLDGLKFLQENFPNLTVDCLFVDSLDDLDEKELFAENSEKQLWRVRAGNKSGSEFNLPQGTFSNLDDVKEFISKQKERKPSMQFVIHRVSQEYFDAQFVGTIAVYNNKSLPSIRIELQRVTKELVGLIDNGKRPRDWETCLVLDYEYTSKFPKIRKNDKVNLGELKYSIGALYEIGREIFELYDSSNKNIDTYTRFNIYGSGKIILDDHRSNDSFISRYRCKDLSPIEKRVSRNKVDKDEEELEI